MPEPAMNQVYFVVVLYLLGLLFGLQFRKHIPIPFICASSFFWGGLFYIFLAITFIIGNLHFSLAGMGGVAAASAAALTGLAVRRKLFDLSRHEFIWCAASIIVFTLSALIASRYNYSQITTDSVEAILRGRALAYDGLSSYTIDGFTVRGAVLPIIQSAGVLLNEGYLAIYQPLLSLSFLVVFILLTFRAIKFKNPWLKFALVTLSAFTLFSTNIVFFQIFYIHTNFFSAAFLFTGLVTFWLAIVEKSTSWLVFSALGLAGFSLGRVESPIFFVILTVLMLGLRQLSYRQRLAIFLPVCAGLIIWHIKIAQAIRTAGPGDTNPDNIWVIIAVLTGLALLVIISKLAFIEKYILPALPVLAILCMAIIIPMSFFINYDLMQSSVTSIYINMTTSGEWNATWFALPGLFFLVIFQKKLQFDSLFTSSFMVFFLLLVDLAFFLSSPYRPSPYGSANRMLTHIIPLIVFYFLVRFSQVLSPGLNQDVISGIDPSTGEVPG
jgi:hypothetical protein